MPKVKLTVSSFEKLELAAKVSDVKIEESENYGSRCVAIVNYRHGSQLFELGRCFETLEQPVKKATKEATDKTKSEPVK